MRGGWTRGAPANSAPDASRLTAAVIFDDPIDLLLDLAERQRLDPSRISLVALVDQFAVACAQLAPHVLIERRTDWLVMATGLVLLRSRLLCPATPKAATEAEHRPHGKSRASKRCAPCGWPRPGCRPARSSAVTCSPGRRQGQTRRSPPTWR